MSGVSGEQVSVASSDVVPSQRLASGLVVGGKYLIGEVIGEGGVGVVYEAQNLELDEKVALKCLRPEFLVDSGMVGRFAREAKAAARIKSEYVATVHDVGTLPDGGGPFMVMERLQGRDLGAIVSEKRGLGPRDAVEYTLQACEALAVAHAMGIVHRDIKPDNLMLTERSGGMRIVKVLDFGISKAIITGSIFRGEVPTVKTMNLMGTPLYMSPEQVRCSDAVDVRSDIWSLGMVLYELVTATTAFRGATLTEVCAAILESAPTPLEVYRQDLPSGLVDVILRCLEKDPTKRYQNVAELAMALMPFGPKRARINVERAVAVLKASGAIHADVRVESTYPMASGSDSSLPPIPGSAPLPSDLSRRSSITANFETEATHVTPRKASRGGAVALAAALVMVLGGGIYVMQHRAAPAHADVAPTPAPVVAPPVVAAAKPVEAAAAPAEPAPVVVAAPVAAAAPVPAPRGYRWTPPRAGKKGAAAEAPAAAAAPPPPVVSAPAKPAAAKPAEPDLGY